MQLSVVSQSQAVNCALGMTQLPELLQLLRSAWLSELIRMTLNCDSVVHSTIRMEMLRFNFHCNSF